MLIDLSLLIVEFIELYMVSDLSLFSYMLSVELYVD